MAMADQVYIDQFQELYKEIMAIEDDKLLRPSVGSLSLDKDFSKQFSLFKKKLAKASEFSDQMGNNQISNFNSSLTQIKDSLTAQASYDDDTYAANRNDFLSNIDGQLDNFETYWMPFLSRLLDQQGLLDNGVINRQNEEELSRLREEADRIIRSASEEAKTITQEAERRAKDTQERAHLTAAHISVKDAQEQFSGAQLDLKNRVRLWAGLSIGGSAVFVLLAGFFLLRDIPDQSVWEVLYKGILKLSLVAFIGTMTAFFVKMFRAHLYMLEKNKHRVRVANCIEAFVNSASTEEQRDSILSQLVDSITQFGNSGLIQREDDSVSRPKMSIESMVKTLSAKSAD